MQALIAMLFKSILEVAVNALLKIFTAPDSVKPDPKPVLDTLVAGDDASAGLLLSYGGLLATQD